MEYFRKKAFGSFLKPFLKPSEDFLAEQRIYSIISICCRNRQSSFKEYFLEVKIIKEYRNEWKYCCTASDLNVMENRLSAILERDSNSDNTGKYTIHSLYFDDYKDSCARENDAGIAKRFKYRIRYYGNRYDFMRLERKEKLNGRCCKESCLLSMEEYQKIVSGNTDELFWQTENPLLKQFCVHCMTREFAPKAIIDYDRVAYVEENTNVRITLDENISVSDDFSHFLDGDYIRYPVLEKRQPVLEVKFDYILPSYIKHIITNQYLVQTAFSKYYLGRKKLQSMKN